MPTRLPNKFSASISHAVDHKKFEPALSLLCLAYGRRVAYPVIPPDGITQDSSIYDPRAWFPRPPVNNDTGVILRTTWGPTSYESFSAFPNGTRFTALLNFRGEGGHERTTRGYPTDSPLRGRLRANSSYVSQLLTVDAVGKSQMARLLALDPSVGLPGSKLRVNHNPEVKTSVLSSAPGV
ncbi:hypothetical protein B0H10DRAFT_2186628 [Mycena sp. CBHHK59/15]|nr:hypothetical protein B0H10DRAFT_2186628 [Mycena sp. CBHHK59/15]